MPGSSLRGRGSLHRVKAARLGLRDRGTIRDGSIPHDAATISLGRQSSIRDASSLAANPPNTTEWIAPSRAQGIIAMSASGTIGM